MDGSLKKDVVIGKIHVVMIFFVVNMHSHAFEVSGKTSCKTSEEECKTLLLKHIHISQVKRTMFIIC